MYITELEIDNFKSFGKKTKIPFYEGFTVVSGPNGSGKSNIIDSILFCLALSSARGLRAEKLTDLINLNTNKNTAEVSIEFSDGTRIRRKIKRTPHGYYSYNYINDRACKQSDVVEFLARLGIKSEGYNVVMQGDITRITEMSDSERRKIIDEIAGVSEFDKKKEQSLSELEVVRERIEREELLLAELQKRLCELETEKKHAEAYLKLKESLEYFKSCMSAARLNECEKELSGISSLESDQAEKIKSLSSGRMEAESEISSLKENLGMLEAEINEKSGSEYLSLLSEIESAKGKISLSNQTIEKLSREKETKKESIQKIFLDSRRAESRVAEITDKIRDLSIDRSNLNMGLCEARAELENVKGDLDEKSQAVEGAKEKLFSLINSLEEKKGKRSDILREQDILIEKSRMRTEEKERIESRIRQADLEIGEKSGQVKEHKKLLDSLNAEKSVIETELSKIEAKLFENRSALEKIRSDLKSKERELMRLEAQQNASGSPGGREMAAILGMDGVFGSVGQLGKAPSEYATALNVAAGGRLRNIVCESDRVAADGIRYLRDNRLGRATFLPLNKLRAPNLPPLNKGKIIDYAVNLLDYDPLYDVVFRYVFGATVVVKDLETARSMIGQYRMVTLSGDLVEKAGAMTGGSVQKKMAGFGLSADDEIEKIRISMSELSQEDSVIQEAVSRYSSESDSKRVRKAKIDDQMSKSQFLCDETERRLKELENEKTSILARRSEMEGEVKSGSEKLSALEESLKSISDEINSISEESEKLKKELSDTGIPELSEKYEELRRKTEDDERRLKNKDYDIEDSQREKAHYTKRLEEMTEERENIEEDIKNSDEEIKSLYDRISESRVLIDELEKKRVAFSDELNELQKKRDALKDEIFTGEKRIIEIDSECEKVKLATASLAERKNTLVGQINELREEAKGIETDMALPEIEAGIEKSEREIKKLGAVNMLAIEEYDKTSERVSERSSRKDVLSKERANILERIEHYEKMKYESFMEAFRAIDANFRKIFARLTEGNGKLVLENDDDPFSGGMTFAVQPREKKVHLLSSLSGGEKSLTTLAFIFSIQQYMPAPFYALDEVDMMLDGSNVERVSSMINELSKNAQTICVSLRKPTIERSDRIIGVTVRPDKSTYVTGVKSNG
ncbi:chromosome segregation protein [Methanomicrobium sp. W14]|uniref:chromosome segregation protein SMC n=1 Tax=Methanomicrobium sp. W14 TaxID=2817839 RepID=UPI001AEB08DA|nr:chromosome segregation protein SMC [Methanomicrobium sp. W14]MBP2133933.1 chromosome segregation protein [Methanomicrobium sp. W14]